MKDKEFVSLLRDIRNELSKRVANHNAERERLAKLNAAIDELLDVYATIRVRYNNILGKPAVRRERTGNAQMALDILRIAERPLTTREIAEVILVQRNANKNETSVRQIIPSIAVALRRYARKGLVNDGGTFPAQWRTVRKPQEND